MLQDSPNLLVTETWGACFWGGCGFKRTPKKIRVAGAEKLREALRKKENYFSSLFARSIRLFLWSEMWLSFLVAGAPQWSPQKTSTNSFIGLCEGKTGANVKHLPQFCPEKPQVQPCANFAKIWGVSHFNVHPVVLSDAQISTKENCPKQRTGGV
jgi:uncharacterized protein (DUF1697 family)